MSAERVTRVLGVSATAGLLALVLGLRAQTRSGADGDALLLFIAFAPPVALLSLAVLLTLGVSLTKGRVRLGTWVAAALPVLLALRLLAVLAGWPLSLDLLNG